MAGDDCRYGNARLGSLDAKVSTNNRQDFSHCEANVKSPLDEVLRRGSVSVKVDGEQRRVGVGADGLSTVPMKTLWYSLTPLLQPSAFFQAAIHVLDKHNADVDHGPNGDGDPR